MLTSPLLVGIILGTAILSSIISVWLPMVPTWINALITRIKRKKNTKPTYYIPDNSRLDDLEAQINNIAERLSNRDKNRRYNTRRDVREYLKELQDD